MSSSFRSQTSAPSLNHMAVRVVGNRRNSVTSNDATRIGVRDWSKSTGGVARGNEKPVPQKNMTHPPVVAQNFDDPPPTLC